MCYLVDQYKCKNLVCIYWWLSSFLFFFPPPFYGLFCLPEDAYSKKRLFCTGNVVHSKWCGGARTKLKGPQGLLIQKLMQHTVKNASCCSEPLVSNQCCGGKLVNVTDLSY